MVTEKQIELDCIKKGLLPKTIEKYIFVCRLVRKLTGKLIDKINASDIETMFLFFHKDKHYAADTKIRYWKVFKKIVRIYNPALQNLLLNYRLNYKHRIKTAEEILTLEEINQLISCARTHRIKTMTALLYETGMRIGEFINLRFKDVIFDEYGAVLSVNGKTGFRPVRIVRSVILLREYMKFHRFKNNPDAPLFYRMDKIKCTPLTNMAVNLMLKETAAVYGIQKRIYCYILRHSRITHLDRLLSDEAKKLYFGWVKNSMMPSNYTHLSGRNVDDRILEINGIRRSEAEAQFIIE